jgi:hypothetical protein
MNRSQIITATRSADNLNDSGTIWTDAKLHAILDNVLLEIAGRKALPKTVCLPFTEHTKSVDISSIDRLVNINQVEYPVGNGANTPQWRKFSHSGNILTIDYSKVPAIYHRTTTGTDTSFGTLTGTLTFTKDSYTVTGVASLFTTELKSNEDDTHGDLIGVSSGSRYYQVAHIASATSLTLDEPFEEETVTDTVDVTKQCLYTACVKVHYGREYMVTRTPTVFVGTGLDDLTVTDSYSRDTKLNYKVQIDATAGSPDTYKWSDDGGATWDVSTVNCATAATVLNNKIYVAFAAIDGHTVGDYWTFSVGDTDLPGKYEPIVINGIVAYAASEFAAFLSEAETALDLPNLATTGELTVGRALINALNEGGDVALKYVQYAQIDIAEAQARIAKARELKGWANMRMAMYQKQLNSITNFFGHAQYNCSRD